MSQESDKIDRQDDFWQPQADPLSTRELEVLRLLADGSSDHEIADALFLSPNTVKWHNRQIYSKPGVGSRTQAVALASREGLLEAQPSRSDKFAHKSRRQLPAQVTSFIGREQEISDVRRLLDSARLLTLTGPAGVGKTRLATQVAAELADEDVFRDGIFFVDLASIRKSTQVENAIVESLEIMVGGGQPLSKILEKYVENKNLCLLLDNFEHVLQAAPLVADLLSTASDLRFLVTSREVLGLYGEQEYPVPPLSLPELNGPASLSSLTDHEAVALFIQRARAVLPSFTVTDEDLPAVAEICVRLDGLPLAIELAAARIKLFSPQNLLTQIESRFTVLGDGPSDAPERQRTLRGAIDWSYELLDDAEKKLFARLSVFQGGRTIEAVEEVCFHDLSIDVLDGLASLLNKSLLRQEEGPEGEPRFIMLETIHEYTRERLEESGEAEDMRRRHAGYFTALAERAEPHSRGGSEQLRWLRRLEADHDNLRAAHEWSMEIGEVELELRLVGSLGYFWWRQGHFAEGQQWIERAVTLIEDSPAAVRARVFSAAGRVAFNQNDPATGERVLNEALEIYREIGMEREIGWALIHLAMPFAGRPDKYEHAQALTEEGLAILRDINDQPGVAQGLTNLGEQSRLQGDLPRATSAFEESLNISREIGDKLREAIALINIGLVAQLNGDAVQAHALMLESLSLAVDIRHLVLRVDSLGYLASVSEALGWPKRAARLFGAVEALQKTYGFRAQSGDLPGWERSRARVREQLDEATFEALLAEGQAMSLEEGIAYALEKPGSDG
jgi:predicted ATPase/DNA-binding CsgD family transcriptional regulator